MTNTTSAQQSCLILGCGDIGERLAAHSSLQNYRITGVRRNPPPATEHLSYSACDATHADQLKAVLVDNYQVIVITMTPSERSDAGYERAYVQTTRQLIASLKQLQLRPQLILFVSSTAVYGQNDGSWVDESSPCKPSSFSGQRLLEAEQILQDSGFPHSILRFSGIYGPGRLRLIEQVKARRASASPAFTNRIHADDCAGVMAHLIELQKQQPLAPLYLASDSRPTPMVEVMQWLGAQLGISNPYAADATNERGNKRCSNQKLLATGYRLRHEEFKSGYGELLHKV
jgi:nucleoside-diphosphate-sugar epimerase